MASPGVFDLEPLIEPSNLPQGIKVTTLELCGNSIYIGTDQGSIIRYSCNNLDVQSVRREKIRDLGPKAPVTFLRSASALDRILALCDTNLIVLNATDLTTLSLTGSQKMRGIQACCINENPTVDDPFALQMCLGKKKQLAVININEEQMSVEKIRELPDPVRHVVMDGIFVCAALLNHYVIFNVSTGACQDLFPYEPETYPTITRISKEEFLLNAPGDLGMCITTEGMSSDRPPIQWIKPVSKFVFCHPHVVALTSTKDTVMVYSLVDQRHKQTLTFNGGSAVGNFDGKLLVASSSSVYRLKPVSIQIQIEFLLTNERVDEALELSEMVASRAVNSNEKDLDSIVNFVRSRAAFISLKKMELRRAQELFIRGRVDPREIISLFPRMLPASSNFTRTVPALHDIADINQVTKMDEEKSKQMTGFLTDFLEYLRACEGSGLPTIKDVDTALVKLYSKQDPEKLVQFIGSMPELACDFEDCLSVLKTAECFHASALLQYKIQRYEEAFGVWIQLVQSVLTDDLFPGLQCIIDKIVESPADVVWRHADFILRQDEVSGAEMFIKHHEMNSDEEKCQAVVAFLQQYPVAKRVYLEHLVNDKALQVEKFHTDLALMYLELILKEDNGDNEEENEPGDFRRKFRQHILRSQKVQFAYLLSRLESSTATGKNLHYEKAILYGKMMEHEKALRIFVYNLKDTKAAEKYCDEMTSRASDEREKEQLLLLYLTVLLTSSHEEVGDPGEKDALKQTAMDLLNRRGNEFRASEALEKIPTNWSLAAIYPAIEKITQKSLHTKRTVHIQKSLSQSVNLGAKLELIQLSREPIILNESSYCVICKKTFNDCQFARYPNGVIVHIQCMKDPKVCPLTGQLFTVDS